MECAETVVLMSVYAKDSPDHFEASLASILEQEYRDFSLYLMLDGKVHPRVLELLKHVGDTRITVFQQPTNQGLAAALNYLIDEAMKSEFIYFARMDADDVSHPSRLAKQVAFFKENPAVDVVGAFCDEVDDAGQHLFAKALPTTDSELKRNMLRRCPFVHSTVVFRRKVFERNIRYTTTTHLTEDMFLWVDLAKYGFRFANIPEPLLKYRVDPNFYRRRRGAKKAISEFRAKRYIARELNVQDPSRLVVPLSAFALRMLPSSLLKFCYRHLR